MKIGYARVSTEEQVLDSQIDQLRKEGCEQVFSEKASGAREERVQLSRAVQTLRAGDAFVVTKLDRLGRSLKGLIEFIEALKERDVEFISIADKIDTSTSTGTFFLHVIGAFAQLERELIRERTNAGLVAARARGRHGGRPEIHSADKKEIAYQMVMENSQTVSQIAEALNISRATIYRYIQKRGSSTLCVT